MSKRKTTKSRNKKKKINKGKELKSLNVKKYQSVAKETPKTKNKAKAKSTANKKTKKQSNKKEIKKNNKKKKPIISIIFVIAIICLLGYFGYVYMYENYKNVGDFTFQTNIIDTSIELSCSNNKLDSISENNVKNSTIHASLYYDQIKIKNNKYEENISSKDTFFKYYGENELIMPAETKYTLDYIFYTPSAGQKVTFEADNDAIKISNNVITAKGNGEVNVYACYNGKKDKILSIISSNLILERPEEFDDTREFLTCEQYSEEENKLLDTILAKKIDQVGYQTRAGAVEALRFLALDLPFRVNYFNENGRLPYEDGQGRYYHKGLYLSSSKFKDLLDEENNGTWGCKIYSEPLEHKLENGLDCSGLIGWALYNAGYDPGDYRGADLLMDLGEFYSSKEIIDSGRVKVGDFVHNEEADSHIGMIIGIDEEDNYYVCQSIWYKPNGVCISKYSKKEFVNHWLHITLLDDYYESDGNLTNMWY